MPEPRGRAEGEPPVQPQGVTFRPNPAQMRVPGKRWSRPVSALSTLLPRGQSLAFSPEGTQSISRSASTSSNLLARLREPVVATSHKSEIHHSLWWHLPAPIPLLFPPVALEFESGPFHPLTARLQSPRLLQATSPPVEWAPAASSASRGVVRTQVYNSTC